VDDYDLIVVDDDDDCADYSCCIDMEDDDTVAHIEADYAKNVVTDAVTDVDSYSESGITVAD
jgi:hypothetical protein